MLHALGALLGDGRPRVPLAGFSFTGKAHQMDHELNGQANAYQGATQVRSQPGGVFDYLKRGARGHSLPANHLTCCHLVLEKCQALIAEWVIHVN